MDGAQSALLPLATDFLLSATQARDGCSVISRGDGWRCQQKHSNVASLRDDVVCPGCSLTKNSLKEVWKWLIHLSTVSHGSTHHL